MQTHRDIVAEEQGRPVRLAPPGAGLPAYERWIGWAMTGVQAMLSTREECAERFGRERARVLELAASLGPGEAGRPVLIARLRGMEDSSRFWSVWMTLDHLRIVNLGVADLITLLAAGKTPARMTGTADVKPSPRADASVVGAFEGSCEAFESAVAAVGDLRTPTRWPHPWFGPMNAAKWNFFAGFHMSLHRRQIEAIVGELGRG